MKSICLVNIWMGKLPNYFELWRNSAEHNPTVDFYIITDNQSMQDSKNIHFIYKTLDEVREELQQLFPFPIKLKTPYKLCDYKMVWWELCWDLVKDYDFIGHCDIDLIFGDIRKFLTDELLDQYDKFFDAGFFILYRNNEEIRNLYKRSMEKDNMAYPYKAVFQCNYACYFDEYMGMSILGWKYCKVFRDQTEEKIVQDFDWRHLNFQSHITDESFVFFWKNGRLFRYICDKKGKILEQDPKEYILVHIQKRNMEWKFTKRELQDKQEFWMIPNCYELNRPSGELYSQQKSDAYAKEIKKKDIQRSIENFKKYGLLGYIPHFFRSRRIIKWIEKEKKFY